MQVSVEKTSELSRKMTVSLPEEMIQKKMEDRFKSLARSIKIDGFRPGKVPLNVVKKRFGDQVKGEVSGDLINSSYGEALEKNDLNPVAQPFIQLNDAAEGFEYTAEFEVYPEISLDPISDIELENWTAQVEESDHEAMINKLKKQATQWNEADRAAQEQDRVTFNYTYQYADAEAPEEIENFVLELDSNVLFDEFKQQLIGMEAGAHKEFDAAFPENYQDPQLAGKSASFKVDLLKVEEGEIPEIDAEFVKSYGMEDGNVEAFTEAVKNNMQRELERGIKSRMKNEVMAALSNNIQIELPKALIDQEIQNMKAPLLQNAQQQNLDTADLDLPNDLFEDQAKRRVTIGLVLAEVIKQNNIQVDEEKVRATLIELASSYENADEVIRMYTSDENRIDELKRVVIEEQAVEWVVGQSKVTEKEVSFDDIMSATQSA